MIRYSQLGRTGINLSALGLGTVKIGRNTNVKYPDAFELPDDRAVINLLESAQDIGINLVDTAPAYGTSEERLGRLLPGPREKWVISTKAGEYYENNASRFDFSASSIRSSVETSLRRLGTDYLDIVLIHSDGNDLQILEQTDAMATLHALKDKGLIRAVGMSTKTHEGGMKALETADVLMVTLNLEYRSQLPVIKRAQELGRGILLKKVLASGHGDAAESLRYVAAVPGVHSAILGTLNPAHLAANAAFFEDSQL